VAPLLALPGFRVTLGLVGGAVLVLIGARTLRTAWRVRLGAETPEETVRPLAALRTGLLATASNPSTIASWAAVFGAASAGHAARGTSGAVALVAGVGVGSFAWHAVLVGGLRLLRRRVGDRTLRTVDAVAGTVLVAGGIGLGVRALRPS
jgi:putative LysE/RhtB family amino acid efflux pump